MAQRSVIWFERRTLVAAGVALFSLATVVLAQVGLVSRAVSAAVPLAGIVPPRNPPKNLPPNPDFSNFCAPGAFDDTVACNTKVLLAIDHARGTEPLGPLRFKLQDFLRLSVPEQMFAIADLERVSRGEPPVSSLTTQLDHVAALGAVKGTDPVFVGNALSGGAQMRAWGSNWADGAESALGSDDGWMYDDGYGSSNYDCRSPNAAGCWGHRDNILRPWSTYLAGCRAYDSHLVMGAAYVRSLRSRTSFAEIFVAACGPKPAGDVFTWAEAQAAIGV